jgi:hypothetical protein
MARIGKMTREDASVLDLDQNVATCRLRKKDKETALLVDERAKECRPAYASLACELTCGERSPRAYPLVVGVFCLGRFLDIPVERAATEAAARASMW